MRKLDWSHYAPWRELIRRRLMAVFASYRPNYTTCAGKGRSGVRNMLARPLTDQFGRHLIITIGPTMTPWQLLPGELRSRQIALVWRKDARW